MRTSISCSRLESKKKAKEWGVLIYLVTDSRPCKSSNDQQRDHARVLTQTTTQPNRPNRQPTIEPMIEPTIESDRARSNLQWPTRPSTIDSTVEYRLVFHRWHRPSIDDRQPDTWRTPIVAPHPPIQKGGLQKRPSKLERGRADRMAMMTGGNPGVKATMHEGTGFLRLRRMGWWVTGWGIGGEYNIVVKAFSPRTIE